MCASDVQMKAILKRYGLQFLIGLIVGFIIAEGCKTPKHPTPRAITLRTAPGG